MGDQWRQRRQRAGVSLQVASTRAGVTTTTGAKFEAGGPDAIRDQKKRAACVEVWSDFDGAVPSSDPPRAA